MTEEADALDEYFTKNLPKVDLGKGGITTRQGFRMVALDNLSEDYQEQPWRLQQKRPLQR